MQNCPKAQGDLGRCILEMVNKGSCKHECGFEHGRTKARGSNPMSRNKQRGNRREKPFCYMELQEPGSCWRGEDKCHFSHNIEPQKRQDVKFLEKIEEERLVKQSVCVNEFQKKDSCKNKMKEKKCSFRHEISEDERNSPLMQQKVKQQLDRMKLKKKEEKESNCDQGKETFLSYLKGIEAILQRYRP